LSKPPARSTRLTGRGAYDALFATGRRRDGVYLQLLSLPAGLAHGRAGYAIPKKLLPLAVDRNRVRFLVLLQQALVHCAAFEVETGGLQAEEAQVAVDQVGGLD